MHNNLSESLDNNENSKINNDFKLSQDELADGWTIHMPKKKYNTNMIKEESIYLYELPPNLFKFFNDSYTITYRLLKYKIIKTEHDPIIISLYNEIQSNSKNVEVIKDLYNYCKIHDITGWLIIQFLQHVHNLNMY